MKDYPSIPRVLYDLSVIPERFLGDARVAKRVEIVALRTRVAEAQGWRCCYCHRVMNTECDIHLSVTLEHWTPASKGGADDYDNCLAACAKCNRRMGDMPEDKKVVLYEANLSNYNNAAKIARLTYNLVNCINHEGSAFDISKWMKNKDPKFNFTMRDVYRRYKSGILK